MQSRVVVVGADRDRRVGWGRGRGQGDNTSVDQHRVDSWGRDTGGDIEE